MTKYLHAINCAGCGANLGATPSVDTAYFQEFFCRNCLRPLQTRLHDNPVIQEMLDNLANKVMVALNKDVNEILKISNIGEENCWWEGTTEKKFLDTDDSNCYDSEAGQSGTKEQE